jgi:hypothetical protein
MNNRTHYLLLNAYPEFPDYQVWTVAEGRFNITDIFVEIIGY